MVGNNYAIHFLCEAKKAGYEVNPQVIQRALAYMSQKSKQEKRMRSTGITMVAAISTVQYIPKKIFILCTSLHCTEKRISLPWIISKRMPENLPWTAVTCLHVPTYHWAIENLIRHCFLPAFQGEESKNSFGGSFYSYLRDENDGSECFVGYWSG